MEWIDREAALTELGVKAQTLYAYVSRAQIAVKPDPADPRKSRYRRSDIDRLVAKQKRGRRQSAIAENTIHWGEPLITTAVATIHQERLIYRGVDAVTLAEHATLEDVAALLWSADEPINFMGLAPAGKDPYAALAGMMANAHPLIGRAPARWRADASDAVSTLATALGARAGTMPCHQRLASGWGLDAKATDRLRRALVLMADHELNPSTFAVRIAASTGASIAASLLAGLCTLSGPLHGMASSAMLALADEAEQVGAKAAISAWLARHHVLPGFGHPLYPGGDPRAIAMMCGVTPDPVMADLAKVAADIVGQPISCDFAIAALVRLHGLPADAGFRIFALSRSVGWAAHAMEQAATGQIIRPRARYTGVMG